MTMNTNNKHLPFLGVGPLYIAIVIALTVASIYLSEKGAFASGKIDVLREPLLILGVIFIVTGLFIWGIALFCSRIDNGIRNNQLVTTGIYAWCRNPLYTGWTFVCIGVLAIESNLWLFLLAPLFFGIMTVMMMYSEEKWLFDLYGTKYLDYCRCTNRCIPWPPKKKK